MPSDKDDLSVEHVVVLTRALAGWIRTVRGDEPEFGITTERAKDDGTVYREFWPPYRKRLPSVEGLIQKGLLFWGANKVTVGITTKGLGVLRDLLDPDRCPRDYFLHVSRLKKEFTEDEIDSALSSIRRA